MRRSLLSWTRSQALALVACAGLVGPGCGGESPYEFLSTGGVHHEHADALWKALPYDRIEFMAFGVHFFGRGPGEYSVVLDRGGECELSGVLPDGREGQFRGTLRVSQYARLCQLAEALGVVQIIGPFEAELYHQMQVYLKIHGPESRWVAEIHEYGGVGPSELWGFKMAIRALVSQVEWLQMEEEVEVEEAVPADPAEETPR